MSRPTRELRLHEELVLLALRDESGTPEHYATMLNYSLAGALLSELVLEGCLSIDEGKKPLVNLLTTKPLHDEVLDEALNLVSKAKRRRRAAKWVSRFVTLRRLRHRIAEGLCRKGILQDSEASVLLFFRRKTYPTLDPRPERELIERMRRAIADDDLLDPRTGLVVALANATGMLRIHFDKTTLKRRKKRLQQIAEGNATAGATHQAVQAALAAIVATTTATNAAVMAAAISATQ